MESALEWAVLAVSVMMAGRLLFKPATRFELRAHPTAVLVTLATAGLGVGALAWACAGSVPVRRAATAVVALVMGGAWWRARPWYGRRRGLPPGSLGLGVSLDAIVLEDFYADAVRRFGPIFKMSQFHRPVVCVTDLPLSRELLRAEREEIRPVRWLFDRLVPGGYVEFMDGDRHARFDELLRPGFGAAAITECREAFDHVIRNELESMARQEGAGGTDPNPFLDRIALACLVRFVLGVSMDDPRAAGVPHLLEDLDRRIEPYLPVPAKSRLAFRRMTAITRTLAETHIAGGAGLGASVLRHVIVTDPLRAGDDAVIGNLVTMVWDGRNLLGRLLRWVLKMSGDHPRVLAQLRDVAASDTAARSTTVDAFAKRFVLETMRMHLHSFNYRRVVEDTTIGPYRVPKGWLIRICLHEAHSSSDLFPAPDEFHPSRTGSGSFGTTEFSPFSEGPRSCPADGFTMAVAESFVLRLALGFDVRVVRDGPAWRPNRHWAYWLPSADLRLELAALGRPPSAANLGEPGRTG